MGHNYFARALEYKPGTFYASSGSSNCPLNFFLYLSVWETSKLFTYLLNYLFVLLKIPFHIFTLPLWQPSVNSLFLWVRSSLAYLISIYLWTKLFTLYHGLFCKAQYPSTTCHKQWTWFLSQKTILCTITDVLVSVSWLLWYSVEYFSSFVYIMIKWSNTTGFYQLLLPEPVPEYLSMHLCHLHLKQSFIYWDVLIMYHNPFVMSPLMVIFYCNLSLGSKWVLIYYARLYECA